MDILDAYPETRKGFLGWMMETYGVTRQGFDTAPWVEQCRAIARYLGYPTVFPSKWTNKDLERKISEYLYLYESARMTYPFGTDDVTKELNRMPYKELNAKFPDMHKPAEIYPSLKDALVEYTGQYQMDAFVLPSLKDALVDMLEPIVPEISEEELWDQIIKEAQDGIEVPF